VSARPAPAAPVKGAAPAASATTADREQSGVPTGARATSTIPGHEAIRRLHWLTGIASGVFGVLLGIEVTISGPLLHQFLAGPPTILLGTMLAVLVLLVPWASWHWIERRTRLILAAASDDLKKLWMLSGLLMLAMATVILNCLVAVDSTSGMSYAQHDFGTCLPMLLLGTILLTAAGAGFDLLQRRRTGAVRPAAG
jgi:hypothetical protein